MYAGWRDVVEGFSKNAFAGVGGRASALVLLIMMAMALYLLPPAALVATIVAGASPRTWAPFAIETAIALGTRLALALAFGQPAWTAALHPLGVAVALYIAARSYWLTRFGGGVRWRGRRYD
jgi:chlorobactene glucosyltransferase